MKIVKKTSNILDLEIAEFRYLIRLSFALMIGGLMVIIGGFPLLHKESVILECDRLESNYVNCNITRNSLLRKQTVNFPQLKKAEIEKIDLEDTTGYRINLMGSMGRVYLNSNYIYSRLKSRVLVHKINKFLDNNVSDNPNFKLEYHDPLYFYNIVNFMIIILGVGISLLIMIGLQDTNYVFNKDSNTLWKIKKNMFNTHKIFYMYLSDITEATIVQENRNEQPTKVYHLVLTSRRGVSDKVLELEGITENQYTEIKDEINDFLAIETQ